MKKYTVHFMTPQVTWEDVEAKDEADAIGQCLIPDEYDGMEPFTFIAIEEEVNNE
jgi:hypothetical protein